MALTNRLRNVKFDKESPARLASALNIQTLLTGVVSRFSGIAEPYSLRMMSRDDAPSETSSKRRKLFRLNGHFALCLLRVYCRRGPNVSVGRTWSHKLGQTECSLTVVRTKAGTIDLRCLILIFFFPRARVYAVGPVRARLRLFVPPSSC